MFTVEFLQKNLSEFGYESFPYQQWKEVFTIDRTNNATIEQTYQWLKHAFKLTNAELVEVTYSIFEVASRYTTAANNSITSILAIADNEAEKLKIMADSSLKERVVTTAKRNEIMQKLFIPVEEALKTMQKNGMKINSGKMSQSEIDAMFG